MLFPACRLPKLNRRKIAVHELAAHILIASDVERPDEWCLVHGHGRFGIFGIKTTYAWLESSNGGWICYDPILDKIWSKSSFQRQFKPLVHARYSARDAVILISEKKHFGEWNPKDLTDYRGLTF